MIRVIEVTVKLKCL